MSRIAAMLRGIADVGADGSSHSKVPSSDEIADVIAEALAGRFGDGWSVDVAVSTNGSGQVTVFGITGDRERDFLVPLIVGQPVVLNDTRSAVVADHQVQELAQRRLSDLTDAASEPECAVKHALVCCPRHGTHAIPPNPHRGCILR